jgi:glycosyltransferase involved in cell wall biosynthesis
VPVKDLGTLVRALALALRQQPNLWLMLAGDGDSRRDVEAAARDAGVIGRTRLLGWNEDLPRIYAAMDVCAMSSLAEGTPVSIIEAMAAGKVVAATNVGGVADVVEDGITGVLTPPGDAEALATALVRLARDPEARQRMGAAGRERARNRYGVERLVRDIELLYHEALAQKRA